MLQRSVDIVKRDVLSWPPHAAPRLTVPLLFHRTDYRSVIASVVGAVPFDEESVHDCVCTYVRAERDRGRAPSDVIVALGELLEQKEIASARVRHALTQQVIPWCVAAYFGASGSRATKPCPRDESNHRTVPVSRPGGGGPGCMTDPLTVVVTD